MEERSEVVERHPDIVLAVGDFPFLCAAQQLKNLHADSKTVVDPDKPEDG